MDKKIFVSLLGGSIGVGVILSNGHPWDLTSANYILNVIILTWLFSSE